MKGTSRRPRRGVVIGLIAGLSCGASALTMNAVSTPPAVSVSADHGVDQIDNGDGTCTTTVAGWVTLPGKCKPRPWAPVRQCAFNIVGSATLGLVFAGAEVVNAAKAGAAGALLGCVGQTA